MPSERVQRQIDSLLDEAEAAIKRSDWALVQDRSENVLALDPDNPDAQAYLAAALRRLGNLTPQAEPAMLSPKERMETETPTTKLPLPLEEVTAAALVAGRYQVQRLLGEGATKKVYLAQDTRLDRAVALALIKTESLDEAGLARVRREAQAMARLGDHPNVVAVYDIGEEADQPYIVSQLMQGGDVERLLKQADDHRLLLADTLRIADQVAAALEHAHAHGIVHRDLKPGNVWLTQDGTAKLGDFGLAIAMDRSRLTQAGMMVGTVSYMPPEQALAGEITPRSDLYSLGCMLYEMVCGRLPFVADESIAIITQHLNIPPIAPTWHRPDCPPALEALILRLLEKDPAKRPASAAVVRQAIADISLAPVVHTGLTQNAPVPYGHADSPLYRRTFVGREPELRQLQTAFDQAASGQGSLMMLVGEPGIGKTALCEQLATYAIVRGGRVLVGHCYEEGSLSLPYLAFVEALRSYVIDRPADVLREELGSGAADVARIVSEVRDKIAVDLRTAADPEEDRWRLLQAVTGFLRHAAGSQPLVLVLEDLHWADRGTLDLLTHLARNVQGARLLIVGTYRDVEVDRAHPLAATLGELRRGSPFGRVLLRGLTADEVQRMLSSIAGQDVTWGLAEAVHRQTEGNPLFVQEVVRYLSEEGLITREDGRWHATGQTPLAMSIPEGLREVIGRRLSRLSAETNQVLAVAAVIGRDFTLNALLAVAPLPESAVVAALEEAVRVAVLEDRSQGGTVGFRFSHAFIRQTLYEEIFTPRRIRLHQQVARALEAQYTGPRLAEYAAELADHFAQSADPADLAKAVDYGEMAAQRALSVYAYSEAVRHLEQALEAQQVLDPSDTARRCDLLLTLGEALMSAGEPLRAATEVAEQAWELASSANDTGRGAKIGVLALRALNRYGLGSSASLPVTAAWVERLSGVAIPGSREAGWAAWALGQQGGAINRFNEGRERLWAARQIGIATGDRDLAAVSVEVLLGRYTPRYAEETWSVVEEVAGQTDQILEHGGSWGLQELAVSAATLLRRGERERSAQLVRRIRASADLRQDMLLAQRTRFIEAGLQAIGGDLTGAVSEVATVRAEEESLGAGLQGRQGAVVYGVRPLLHLGRFDEALELVEALPQGGRRTVFSAAQTLCWALMGQRDAARQAVLDLMDLVAVEADAARVAWLVGLLESAVVVEEHATVERLLVWLELVVGEYEPFTVGTIIGRIMGEGAVMLGRLDEARRYYALGQTIAEKLQHRPELALLYLDLAELEQREGKNELAQAHLGACIPEFEAMQMEPALEKALRLQEVVSA